MVQYRLNLKMNDTRATNSYKLFNVKVVVSATLRSVARDSCSMFIVCILHKSATMVDGRYMENCGTTRHHYFCLMCALKTICDCNNREITALKFIDGM